MANVFTNTNLAGMNKKQLQQIARNLGVAPVTIHSILTTPAALITAIRAK